MAQIFISYRRVDSQAMAGRIYDRLAEHLGHQCIFMDIDKIPIGTDFRRHISRMLDMMDAMLVIIGDNWLDAHDASGRRLDDPADYVRIEIETAINKDVPIVPVAVGQTRLPTSEELPRALQPLAFRNGIRVDPGADFHHHVTRLLLQLKASITTLRSISVRAREKPPLSSNVQLIDASLDSQDSPYMQIQTAEDGIKQIRRKD